MRSLTITTLLAAISLYILNVIGGMARAIGPNETLALAHNLAALLSGGLLLAGLLVAWRTPNTPRLLIGSLSTAALLMGVQAAASATGKTGISAIQSGIHLALALAVQGLVLLAAATAISWLRAERPSIHLQYRSTFARLSLATLAALLILFVSGAVVSRISGSDCTTWPLCAPATLAGWISLLHRGVVLAAALLVGALFVQAWRTQRSQTMILVSTTAMAVLFLSQALLGAKLVQGFPAYLVVIHQGTALAVWVALLIAVIAAGLAGRTAADEQAEAQSFGQRHDMVRDLLLLTKPIVVALLLVTTYAGMVIGARAWPAWNLVLWTMLGGFLAAGGSGAINQYIDRADDSQMQRTQKRPIPAGRLTPGEGLAFGVAATLLSFYLMVAFVNLPAALLTLAGIIYYVVLYSMLLKKTTVQNIVIGGGAGAIPPLVGWAAATGGLNVPSLFLFAIVFLWTPPHFWALALVRRQDYARAGVPMLPVIRGEKETQRQILIYTLELVALTLLLPVFGLGGGIYFIGAGLLGLWLISAAWKVWKQGGNKLAWKMYRYSSMYLAFLFVVLMVDALM
jgi:protoheme IX farnesyltransferase